MTLTRLALLAALLCLACGAAAPAAATTIPSPLDTVLAQAQRALGLDALSHVRTLHLRETLDVTGIAATQQEWLDLQTGASAEYTTAGPQSGAGGFDGNRVWSQDAKGLVWDDGAAGARIRAQQDAYLVSYGPWRPDYGGATLSLQPPVHEGQQAYDVVSVQLPGLPAFELWFDASSHLPVRLVRHIGRQRLETRWSDYRAVDGLEVAFRQHDAVPSGAGDLTVVAVQPNDAQAAAELMRPASHADDATIEGGTSTSVPIAVVENHVYLDATIDGQGPFHFIFDTGGANILDVAVAKRLGLTGVGNARTGGVGAGSVPTRFATVDRLRLGNAVLTNQEFAITTVHHGFAVSGGRPADGLIGFEVLARFVTTFDYARHRVVLQLPSARPTPDPGGAVMPFFFNGTTPAVACRIDALDGTCTVDTGSRDSLDVDAPFARAHPAIVPANVTAVGVGGYGFGGPLLNRLGRTALGFGPFALPDTITGFTAQDVGAFADPFLAGNIGGGVLRRFTLTFDYPAQTLTAVPNAEYDAPEAYDRSGLFLVHRGGGIVVEGVRPGTPAAEAGLKQGDVIARVDHEPADALGLAAIRRTLMATTPSQVDVSVARGSATRDVVLSLRDYV